MFGKPETTPITEKQKQDIYNHRIACLNGADDFSTRQFSSVPVKGFLFTSAIQQQVEGEENQRAVQVALNTIYETTPDLKYHLGMEIRGGGNCSARAVMFGTLIAASIAIKNTEQNPVKANAMQKTLDIMLENAEDLKQIYLDGNPLLRCQSGQYPKCCNAIIDMIEAIKRNEISTTEIIFQANKDAHKQLTDISSFNVALVDLSNYMLYQEAVKIGLDVMYFRENAANSEELLKIDESYSTTERSLVCQRLQIGSQCVAVNTVGRQASRYQNTVLVKESQVIPFDAAPSVPEHEMDVSFTTVTSRKHTFLALDAPTLEQFLTELRDEQQRNIDELPHQFSDPETYFSKEGIVYTPKQQEPAAKILLLTKQATRHLTRLGQVGKILNEEIALLIKGASSQWPTHQGSQEKLEAIVMEVNRLPETLTVHELNAILHDQNHPLTKAIRENVLGKQESPVSRQADQSVLDKLDDCVKDAFAIEMTTFKSS